MLREISSSSNLSSREIEKIINASEDYDTICFDGVFHIGEVKRFFLLGKEAVQSAIMITKPNLRLDFSKARILFDLSVLSCKTAFLYVFQTACNIEIIGLHLSINYVGEDSKQTLYGLYNCGHSMTVDNSIITIHASTQINAVALYNFGGQNTPLDTRADNLSVTNCRFRVHIQAQQFDIDSEAVGIQNYFANSAQIANTYLDIKINGNGSSQRAIGLYNNGRFCRFCSNNIKANGSHNKGLSLQEAHSYGMIDEGMYTLVSNCNIVGEWGGNSIGLYLKGEFANITGNKILSTHTIKGITVKIEANKIVLADNILISTSRNARVISAISDVVTISGNILEILMNLDDCRSGVGAYIQNSNFVIFTNNQLRTIKTCGLYTKNSSITARDNLYQKEGLPSDFVAVANDSVDIEQLLDENRISSIVL